MHHMSRRGSEPLAEVYTLPALIGITPAQLTAMMEEVAIRTAKLVLAPPAADEWLSLSQAARESGLSMRALQRRRATGALRTGGGVGHRPRVLRSELMAMLEGKT